MRSIACDGEWNSKVVTCNCNSCNGRPGTGPSRTGRTVASTWLASYSTVILLSLSTRIYIDISFILIAVHHRPRVGAMVSGIDTVLQALSPQIVIFSDESVDQSCRLNGCKGLDQLFKPWQSSIERGPSPFAPSLVPSAHQSSYRPVSIRSSLLSPTTHPTFAVRFTSHAALLQSHFGGGGTVPYSPDIVADIVSNLVCATTPGESPSCRMQCSGDLTHVTQSRIYNMTSSERYSYPLRPSPARIALTTPCAVRPFPPRVCSTCFILFYRQILTLT